MLQSKYVLPKCVGWFVVCALIFVFAASVSIEAAGANVLTLEQAMDLALRENGNLANSQLDEAKAETDLVIAWRNLLPKVNLQTSYIRLDEGPVTPDFTKISLDPVTFKPIIGTLEGSPNIFNTQLTFQQPLFVGGKALLGIEMAKLGVDLAEVQEKKTAEDTLFQVIQSYFNVLLAAEMVGIQESAGKLIEEHSRIMTVNYEAGLVLRTDLLKVELEKGKAAQSLQTARNNLYLAKRSLAMLLGLPDANFETMPVAKQPRVELELADLTSQAQENRPELQMLNVNEHMLEDSLTMEKRSYWPNVFLGGNYSWKGDKLTFKDGSWNLTVTASMALFDGGIASKKREGLRLQLEKIEQSRESLTDMLKLEIEEALLRIAEAQDSLVLQEMSLKNAEENLRMVTRSFELGVGPSVEVLNAQTLLQQAQVGLMQTQYQYQLGLFKVLYKSGQLLEYYQTAVKG